MLMLEGVAPNVEVSCSQLPPEGDCTKTAAVQFRLVAVAPICKLCAEIVEPTMPLKANVPVFIVNAGWAVIVSETGTMTEAELEAARVMVPLYVPGCNPTGLIWTLTVDGVTPLFDDKESQFPFRGEVTETAAFQLKADPWAELVIVRF